MRTDFEGYRLPECDTVWTEWCLSTFETNVHPLSTLKMETVPSKVGKNYTASHNIHRQHTSTFLQNVRKHIIRLHGATNPTSSKSLPWELQISQDWLPLKPPPQLTSRTHVYYEDFISRNHQNSDVSRSYEQRKSYKKLGDRLSARTTHTHTFKLFIFRCQKTRWPGPWTNKCSYIWNNANWGP
jgi:hypothetical protein